MSPSIQLNEARNPARWKILGRRLHVFTVAHSQLLDEIGYDAADISPEDLLVAIRICALKPKRARKALARSWSAREFLTLILFRLRPDVFRNASAAFHRYTSAANITPRLWADPKQTKPSTCPASLMLERDLMHYWHFSLEQVLAMPLGEAEFRRLAMLEAKGAIEFFTSEDDAFLIECAKVAREWAEQDKREEATNGAR